MKVYVDELPKDCIGCPCESEYYCNLLNEDIGFLKWGEVHQNCPLQSISDYTKQVRKEICNKIRENAISRNDLEVDMYYITPQQLYGIEKGENDGR